VRRRRLLVLAALLLLGGCGLVALPSALSTSDARGTVTATVDQAVPGDDDGTAPLDPALQQPADPADPPTVQVSGSTTGLVPGRRSVLPVVVRNPETNPEGTLLTVTRLRVQARGPAGSCPPEDLVVTGYDGTGRYRAAHGRSVVVPLPVLLVDRPDRDQTDCAGATFPLRLTVVAEVSR
jgi:hypothetical protein